MADLPLPGTSTYQAIVDHALMTTRGVRRRLDFDRDVDDQTILDCIDVAEQAPTGGNNGSRRWMIIRDQAIKDRMAELYLSAGVDWVIETAKRLEGTGHQNERLMHGARHLGENIARTPALVIPTIIGRHDGSGRPGLFDSVVQSAWSFMVALRSRGLGTVWTTMYLNEQDAVAELLGLPDNVTQICLFPVAYTVGTDFKPTTRRYPARDIAYFDRYGHTRAADGTEGLASEVDVKVKPRAVLELIDYLSHPADWRVVVEQVPGGSRIRAHAPGSSDESLDRIDAWLSKVERAASPAVAGNVLALEHVNVTVPDHELASLFYVTGLGFTRDPYIDFGTANMWINLGAQQFHLPKQAPQVLRGSIGLVVPDLDQLERRLSALERQSGELLEPTAYRRLAQSEGTMLVICPWGNRLMVHAAGDAFGRMKLGMPYVDFDVAPGGAAGIARFYQEILGAPASVVDDGTCAQVIIGNHQVLRFREATAELPPYDGHHIAIYLSDFDTPHEALEQRGLITRETSEFEYRFENIIDLDTGAVLATVEHEVRSRTHPMFGRPLVNRNPEQSLANYRPGHDAFVPATMVGRGTR